MTTDSTGGINRRRLLGAIGVGAGALLVSSCTSAGTPDAPASGDLPLEPSAVSGDVDGYRSSLTLLGTAAGPMSIPGRSGVASAVTVDGHHYLVDAGPGSWRRLAQAGLSPNLLDGVFITHLHSDHVADLFNLFLLNNPGGTLGKYQGGVPIYGPGPAGELPPPYGGVSIPIVNNADPAPGLAGLLDGQMQALRYDINVRNVEEGPTAVDYNSLFKVREIALPPTVRADSNDVAPRMAPFTVHEDDRVKVTAVLVPHYPVFPSYAFRFDSADGSITFSGDTGKSDNVVDLARGTDILVHEAIDAAYYARTIKSEALDHFMMTSHTSGEDVGRVATAAGVKKVVLSHIGPGDPRIVSDDEWSRRVSSTYDGPVVVGRDLTRMGVGKRA